MTPAGHRPDVEPAFRRPALHDAKSESRALTPRGVARDHLNHVPLLVLEEPVGPFPLFDRAATLDNRPVVLLDRPVAELLRQSRRGLAGPREQDDARRGPVEPMDEPDVHVSRLAVLPF